MFACRNLSVVFDIIERMFDPEYGYIADEVMAGDNTATWIPAGLDEMEPGPFLAAILEHTNVADLSGYDRIVFLRAQQRMASHYSAGVYDTMAAVAQHMRDEDDFDDYMFATEAAAAEIRAALRLTRRATDTELSFALELRERLPKVWAALAAGDIDVRRAKTIAHHTYHLTAATAGAVVEAIIEQAPRLTTGQLAARLKRLCIEANPTEAADRYRNAVEERRLVAAPNVDGTTTLTGYQLPPDKAAAAMARINHIARSLRHKGENRSMDQLRADVYLDILTGTNHATIRHNKARHNKARHKGGVDLHVDLETLARLNDNPGELAGYGPVIADIARRFAEEQRDGRWRYTITDPGSGRPIATGITRRRPTTTERHHVQARDRSCIFPGCRMPAVGSDLDHRIPHSEGGPTDTDHLAPLCRYDHCVRHQHGWTYRPLLNGDYQWTTKLGHTYTTSGAPP